MNRLGIIVQIIIALAAVSSPCAADSRVGIKTNLLYDALLSPNLGVEFAIKPHWSIDLSGNYNGWKLSHNRQWKHWLVQPEARYWLKDAPFKGHFLAANLFGGEFNTTLGKGDARRQGWVAGLGVGYGYTWRWGTHWGLEAELTVGYARYGYDKYPCTVCGRKIATRNRNYVGPTKAAINLVYYFGRGKKAGPVVVLPQPVIDVEEPKVVVADTLPVFHFALVDVPHSRVLSQTMSGVARVQFALNRTELDAAFGNNAAEVSSIIAKLDSIRDDLDMTVVSVKFTGYASPEGSYGNNDRLAAGRTAALAHHILQARHLPDSVVSRLHIAEDWAGLRRAVEASALADKAELLALIDGHSTPDAKEAALKRHRASWAWMAENVLPALRRTEYQIEYEHRYEERETQTLEQVNKAIAAGDVDTAARLLVDIPSSPEADYARGVVAALQQRYTEAKAWFTRAQARGIGAATDALNQLRDKVKP